MFIYRVLLPRRGSDLEDGARAGGGRHLGGEARRHPPRDRQVPREHEGNALRRLPPRPRAPRVPPRPPHPLLLLVNVRQPGAPTDPGPALRTHAITCQFQSGSKDQKRFRISL